MNLELIILNELQRGGPPAWVSGRTYRAGMVARSPSNWQCYIRTVNGNGANDPAADAANWMKWSKGIEDAIAVVNTAVGGVATSVNNVGTAVVQVGAKVDGVRAKVDAISAAVTGIKSVQRGVTLVSGAKQVNVTISAVNMNKARVHLLSSGVYGGNWSSWISAALIASNALQLKSYIESGGTGFGFGEGISWEVIEEY